jgi:hypothetical protein
MTPSHSTDAIVRNSLKAILVASVVAACTAGAQKPAVETVLADKEQRAESLEATLRVTDEHPDYVDELFVLTRKHPRTLNRFLENTARTLEQDEFATMTAKHLGAHPPGLKRVMVKTLDEISDDPVAMTAVAEAMVERSEVSAMVIVQKEEAVRALVTALVRQVQKNAKARAAFVQAMQDNSDALAQIAIDNPRVVASLAKAVVSLEAERGKKRVEEAVK